MQPSVAVVLPPSESFSPDAAGAVALLVRRLAGFPGAFSPIVLGMATKAPFTGAPFLPIRPAWRPAALAIRYAAGIARALERLSPALVEVHNRPDVALFLAARQTVPVTLFLHNDPQGMRGARTPSERTRLLERLARVATVSAFLRARLLDGIAAPARPPVVLPNCLDLSRIPPSPAQRDPVILFAGRIVSDKGADSFLAACIRALPRLPGWRAELVGADRFGPDSPETAFLRRLRAQAAAAGITLHGYRPHGWVLSAMTRASMVVVPSRWAEPFGLTALEAMACGAPLLCSPGGGLAEVAGPAAVTIDPDDVPALGDAIVALAGDPARRAALSAAGLARAREFDLPHAAARLDALRTDVLAAWSARAPRPI